MTADEFLEMPDDGLRHELIRGEVVTMSLPGGEHGEIALEIGRLIANHVKSAKLGEDIRRGNRVPHRTRPGHSPRRRRGFRASGTCT